MLVSLFGKHESCKILNHVEERCIVLEPLDFTYWSWTCSQIDYHLLSSFCYNINIQWQVNFYSSAHFTIIKLVSLLGNPWTIFWIPYVANCRWKVFMVVKLNCNSLESIQFHGYMVVLCGHTNYFTGTLLWLLIDPWSCKTLISTSNDLQYTIYQSYSFVMGTLEIF